MDAAHQPGKVLEVSIPELLEALSFDCGEDLVATRRGIAADIIVFDEVGSYGQDEGHRIGVCDHQAGIRSHERSLLRHRDDISLETHPVALDLCDQIEDPGREIAPSAVHGQAVAI